MSGCAFSGVCPLCWRSEAVLRSCCPLVMSPVFPWLMLLLWWMSVIRGSAVFHLLSAPFIGSLWLCPLPFVLLEENIKKWNKASRNMQTCWWRALKTHHRCFSNRPGHQTTFRSMSSALLGALIGGSLSVHERDRYQLIRLGFCFRSPETLKSFWLRHRDTNRL